MVNEDVTRGHGEADDGGGGGQEKEIDNGSLHIHPSEIVNFVLVDTQNFECCIPIDKEKVEAMGIVVMDLPLISDDDATRNAKRTIFDPTKVAEVLITLGS